MSQKYADPKRIVQHAGDLRRDVISKVKKAGDTLTKDGTYNLEGGDFSITCAAAAAAYPLAVQFAFEDIKMLMTTAKRFAEKVEKAADVYQKADSNSTV